MSNPIDTFAPFANDEQSLSLGAEGLTLENGTDKIVMYGDLTIEKNASQDQRAFLDDLIRVLTKIRASL